MKLNKFFRLLAFILVSELSGFIGTLFTTPSIPTWYAFLNKPAFTPPNWLFAPAWTILYLLMGISVFLIWEKKSESKEKKTAIQIFFIQLAANMVWSIIFFGLQMPFIALLEIIVLWFLILITILKFNKLNKVAAYLLIPYIIWTSFALILNLAIVLLN